jgi:hypothetical protein
MIAIAVFLFWYFKKKQWIMANGEEELDKQGTRKQ